MAADESESNLHYVADVDEFESADRIMVDVEGREIAVFKIDDEFVALLNYCVHQGGPLCEGKLAGMVDVDDDWELIYTREDQVLSCPWHGWEFDVLTGEHLSQTGYRIPQYETAVRDGAVYVEL